MAQFSQNLRAREQPHPGGRQLNGQRRAIQQLANLYHGRFRPILRLTQGKAGFHLLRPLHKQGHGWAPCGIISRGGQSGQRQHMLFRQVQPLTRSYQQVQARRLVQ